MNYQKIYNQIIVRGKVRKLDYYKERHHIIPKCMGGSNKKDNLVELTAKEHFICHKLLTEIYPQQTKLHYATWMMVNVKNTKLQKRDYIIGANEYQRLKENLKHSESHNINISKALTGRKLSITHRKNIGKRDYPIGKYHKKSKTYMIESPVGKIYNLVGKFEVKQFFLNQNKILLGTDFVDKKTDDRKIGWKSVLYNTTGSKNWKLIKSYNNN